MKNIGIIGYGNMGAAIAQRIKDAYAVAVFDKDASKIEGVQCVAVVLVDLVEAADAIILAVKPQDFDTVLAEIKGPAKGKLIISIAAGITTSYIEKVLSASRVVRVMPNIEIMIGRGVTHLCKGKSAQQSDLEFAFNLFNSIVTTKIINEDMMNAATAVSGSRLAYFCDLIERENIDYGNIPQDVVTKFENELKSAAELLGFEPSLAGILSSGTGPSCEVFFKEKHLTPQELREKITSKKGTTEAALEVLRKKGTLLEALQAAVKRAQELSKT